ncbi:MAG TPA: transglutaminase family protein [Propioniciclava sp.]|uniref:transglutaminase-like domain-containing protein n=1 Tax=Propioniciclava sp. TaxID=2038686 RepID=UPI002CF41B04|nr:transglutaminase family protein [Propioniciclava sp.]HRL49228.1 transglutaminase family protein [Propioniciclava sp.]HRL79121.1 transglutaminase family protein [Propioniciclava sp.]
MSQPLTHVSSHLEAEVTAVAEIVLSVAVAYGGVEETLQVTLDGVPLEVVEVTAPHGTRLHVLRDVAPGSLVVDYRASVPDGHSPGPVSTEQVAADPLERITYLRPSRYAESDALAHVAAAGFDGLDGKNLLDAVSSWVGQHLTYVSGSSGPTDGAVKIYLERAGVCRDYAHLVTALLRSRGVPARLVSVYAPGLEPMDFHAVVEARLDDAWYLLDATNLAPRQAMVRIATGRDAADTAFMTVNAGGMNFTGMRVTAVRDPDLPVDDITTLVRLP